jgi:hypothetical protein
MCKKTKFGDKIRLFARLFNVFFSGYESIGFYETLHEKINVNIYV